MLRDVGENRLAVPFADVLNPESNFCETVFVERYWRVPVVKGSDMLVLESEKVSGVKSSWC